MRLVNLHLLRAQRVLVGIHLLTHRAVHALLLLLLKMHLLLEEGLLLFTETLACAPGRATYVNYRLHGRNNNNNTLEVALLVAG